jgi:glutamine synthetase
MKTEPIVFVGTSDLSGHFRGKSFPAADLAARLARGVGSATTNLFLSAFGTIHYTPFGTQGEVMLVPDETTRVFVPFDGTPAEHFYIGDFKTLTGQPWDFCPRELLRRALKRLHQKTGLRVLATFEQEFTYSGAGSVEIQPYELDAYRRQGVFGEAVLAALRQAGVVPDTFLAEFGPGQFEVTTTPQIGLRAADNAVISREIIQAVAFRLGHRVSFTPVPVPNGTCNGTHIHWSFLDDQDRPVLHEPAAAWELATVGRQFIAGIQHHLPALCAVTAPSPPSYHRLRPNRWAPVMSDVGAVDRGTAQRICPLTALDQAERARQFNVEFRVADATASPYLALAALIHAGLDGILSQRDVITHSPPSLPTTLGQALDLLETCPPAREWFGEDFIAAYLRFKRGELDSTRGWDDAELCRRYGAIY